MDESKIPWENFKLIRGGNEKDQKSDEKIQLEIQEGIANQKNLSPRENLELAQKIKESKILELKKKIMSFSGIVLPDKDVEFIHDSIPKIVLGNQEVIDESYAKFPKLKDYFDMILRRLKEIKEERRKQQDPKIIKGGKEESKKDKLKKIIAKQNKDANNLKDLSFDDYVYLARSVRRMGYKKFGKELSKFCGVILSQNETKEIFQKITEGTIERRKNIKELNEKFPRLNEYFNMILEKID